MTLLLKERKIIYYAQDKPYISLVKMSFEKVFVF